MMLKLTQREQCRLIFTIFILAGGYINVNAQWVERNNGLSGGDIRSFASIGSNLFAGGSGGGMFLSTDNGTNWTPINNGLNVSTYSMFITSLAVSGSDIFAGTGAGVFKSSDNGANWTQINPGLTTTDIRSITANGSNIFIGTYSGGVFRSTDGGVSWESVTVGLTASSIITSLVASGSNVFAGTYSDGIFLSTNNGDSWTSINSGLSDTGIRAIAVKGNTVFVGTNYQGIFASADNGSNWTAVNTGLTNQHIYSLATDGVNIFTGTNGDGVFRSGNDGATWTKVNTGLTEFGIPALMSSGGNVFAGTFGAGIFRSSDSGASWTVTNLGLNKGHIGAMAVSGSKVFASVAGGQMYISDSSGSEWTSIDEGLTATSDILSLVISGNNLFAGTRSNGIFLSPNNGSSWSQINSSLSDFPIWSMAVDGTNVFAGTMGGGVFTTNNNGVSWSSANVGLTSLYINSLVVSNNTIFAGTGGGLFKSNDSGASWTMINSGLTETSINCIASNGNNVFVSGNNSISFSGDNGVSWSPITSGSISNILSLGMSGRIIFAGTSGGLFLSYDNGSNWISVNTGLPPLTTVSQIVASEDLVLAGTQANGVWSRPMVELKKNQAITFNLIPDKTYGDANFDLIATATSELPINYTSSDIAIAFVNGSTVNILNAGMITVTAAQEGDDIYNPAQRIQQTLTIKKATQQITFDVVADRTIGDGGFDLVASSSSSLPVSFETTSDKISISESHVDLLKPGRVVITATQPGNSNYGAASKDQSFCIHPAKPVIGVNNLTLSSNTASGNQWFLNEIEIPGAINQTLLAAESGTYKVQVKVDDCASEFSDDHILLVTELMQGKAPLMVLYPNPVTDWLTITFGDSSENKEVIFYQITGEQILSVEVSGNEIRLNVSDFAKGIYLAKYISNSTTKVVRFVKM